MWPLKYRVRRNSQKNQGGNDKNVGEAKEIGLPKKGMTDAADTPVGRANDTSMRQITVVTLPRQGGETKELRTDLVKGGGRAEPCTGQDQQPIRRRERKRTTDVALKVSVDGGRTRKAVSSLETKPFYFDHFPFP